MTEPADVGKLPDVTPAGADHPSHGPWPADVDQPASMAGPAPAWSGRSGEPDRAGAEDLVATAPDVRWMAAGDVWWEEAVDSVRSDHSPRHSAHQSAGWVERPARPGPRAVPEDVWDLEPEPDDLTEGPYQGRRRANAPTARLWLALVLVVTGLGAAIGVSLALVSSGDHGRGPFARGTNPAAILDEPTPSSAESMAASTSAGTTGTPSPAAASPSPSQPAPPPGGLPPSPTSVPSPFTPLAIEAETGTLAGAAATLADPDASNGVLVTSLGMTDSGLGRLTLAGITVPVGGTYELTFYYRARPNTEAWITVNGAEQRIRPPKRFACCGSRTVPIELRAGSANTIEFSNGDGLCPDIDRIVISRP